MRIAVLATEKQWEELTAASTGPAFVRMNSMPELAGEKTADAYFNLLSDAALENYDFTRKPVFIHAVSKTLKECNLPEQVIRINAWTGFLSRGVWEIAGRLNDGADEVLKALGKKADLVADEPGFIAARVIAMIVNEAYFALEDGVSTPEEIDTAMKLGTNYPFGPFEWSAAIGLSEILSLLDALRETSPRYEACSLLRKTTQTATD